MFERYTERARRVIFFARYEASQFGSTTIESEHVLLGLCREDKQVVEGLIGKPVADIRKKVEERTVRQPRVPTSIDLPLSHECKRILAYANEESERLNHRHIGSEHIFLGLLRESSCMAAKLLTEMGAKIETLRDNLAKKSPSELESQFSTTHVPPADRSRVHELVDHLPEELLGWAAIVLQRSLGHGRPTGPMEGLFQLGAAMSSMAEQLKRDTAGKVTDGRFTSSLDENGALVIATQQLFHNHQLSITERMELSDDGKRIFYSQEVVGPKVGQQHRHAMEFDID